MKKVALLSLLAMLFFATLANADDLLFYGGDFDPNNPNANGLANENDAIVGGNPYGAATYWKWPPNPCACTPVQVSGLFTNDLSTLTPASAYWEIRTGVSEGNGGTLVASGTGTGGNFSWTPTGRSGFGFAENQALVSGLNIGLQGNTDYWFAVVPQAPNQSGRSFNSNTFGLNSVGTQSLDQQFWNSAFFGANFTNADNEGVFPAFSSGVIGTVVVPEPDSMIMLGSGLVAAAGVVRRRLSR